MISTRAAAVVAGLVFAGILFAVVYRFTGTAQADAVPRKPAPIPVEAALTSRVDLPLYIDAIGTAQAARTATVTSSGSSKRERHVWSRCAAHSP